MGLKIGLIVGCVALMMLFICVRTIRGGVWGVATKALASVAFVSAGIIALGVNGAGFLPAETVVSDVAKIATLAKETCPDSVIVIQSILPVSDIKTEVSRNLTNEKIDACNDLLIDLATENNYLYMDLSPIMKNSEGKLHADYDYGDGLHFNENAYIVMKNYWRTHEIVTN